MLKGASPDPQRPSSAAPKPNYPPNLWKTLWATL